MKGKTEADNSVRHCLQKGRGKKEGDKKKVEVVCSVSDPCYMSLAATLETC